ncbi:MAG TPA: sigma-70 family RNA polymerase sigma factor [Planctomycetota bacterium]|nr:sigma-70 family RNA polymerase sigma factor [Planctomycetota bacterium]
MAPADEVRIQFERLSLPLKNELYRAARALAASDADALDLVQETYLRAWKAFAAYREKQRFRAWIFTILRHAHVDLCRRRRLQPATTDPGELPEPQAPSPAGTIPEDMQAALARLRPAHHLLLLLREIQGFSYREIAEILGWPAGSVMSGLHFARAALRLELGRGGVNR